MYKKLTNFASVSLPEDLVTSYFRESGCKYAHSKAREKLIARSDKCFI
jgi:hypothetical protein